jgi:hypothetical protein
MARCTFTGEDNKPDYIEKGVYPFTVVWSKDKIDKNSGDEKISMLLEEDKSGVGVFDDLVFNTNGQRHIDTFLTATGKAPQKGEKIELTADIVKGWRLFAEIRVAPVNKEDPDGQKCNRIVKFITDKGVPEPKNDLPF